MPEPDYTHAVSANLAILSARLKALEDVLLPHIAAMPGSPSVAALRKDLGKAQADLLEATLLQLENANPEAAAYVQSVVDQIHRKKR